MNGRNRSLARIAACLAVIALMVGVNAAMPAISDSIFTERPGASEDADPPEAVEPPETGTDEPTRDPVEEAPENPVPDDGDQTEAVPDRVTDSEVPIPDDLPEGTDPADVRAVVAAACNAAGIGSIELNDVTSGERVETPDGSATMWTYQGTMPDQGELTVVLIRTDEGALSARCQ